MSAAARCKIVRWSHMRMTREYLLDFFDRYPGWWRKLVTGAKTRAEARRFIADGPSFHPVGECEGFDYDTGTCPGHDKP